MDELQTKKLENILKLKNLKKIKEEIINLGYRCANKKDGFEYDVLEIIEQEKSYTTDTYEDVFDDHSYFAEVYENIKGYEAYTFIVVAQLAIYRDKNNFDFPEHIDLYTNAPKKQKSNSAKEKEKV